MIIFAPSSWSTISHVPNVADVIGANIQHELRWSQSEGSKEQIANSFGTLTTHTLTAQASTNTNRCGSGQSRDKNMWPFACNSIWNVPIGSKAIYVDADIGSKGIGVDTEWYITTTQSDPVVPAYTPPTFGPGRCSGTLPQQQAQWQSAASQPLNVPENLLIPDATNGYTPNNASAFLQPDGETLVSFNVTARCQPGAPLYGNWFGQQNIYGDGIDGGHGGSGMSSIGGSIRTGELTGDNPIRHALKIDVWGKWLNYNPSSSTPGHRWPAPLADAAASSDYQGSNPALVMGSLLAIPPNVTADSLGLTSKAGKKIFQAMQDYGAYIVDDSGWDYNYLCVEQTAQTEYSIVNGYDISQDPALQADFANIIGALKVVDNNGENSIGGGGRPRRPLAPPIGN